MDDSFHMLDAGVASEFIGHGHGGAVSQDFRDNDGSGVLYNHFVPFGKGGLNLFLFGLAGGVAFRVPNGPGILSGRWSVAMPGRLSLSGSQSASVSGSPAGSAGRR